MRSLAASVPGFGGGRPSLPSPQRWMRKAWGAYCHSLTTSPLATQSLTAVFGFVAGDVTAQLLSAERAACRRTPGGWQFDWQRTTRLGAFGGLIAGPMGHLWFQLLDARILPHAPRSAPAITLKCVLDQTFMAPLGCALFYAFTSSLAGKPEEAVPLLRSKLKETLFASYKLWPAAHLLNFALVPPSYRVLYTNIVSILWTFILSRTAASRPQVAATGLDVVPLCTEVLPSSQFEVLPATQGNASEPEATGNQWNCHLSSLDLSGDSHCSILHQACECAYDSVRGASYQTA